MRHGYHVAPTVSMRIWVPSGSVRVTTWDRDSIHVEGRISSDAKWFGGGNGGLAKLGVDTRDTLSGKLPRADLVIAVPLRAHLWIKMTTGDIDVGGTRGELEIITVGGRVGVRDANGAVIVESIDAAVMLADVDAMTRLRTGSGAQQLRNVHGTLSTTSISGGITLTGTALDDARIETLGGAVTINGTLGQEALLDIQTHDGTVNLNVDPLSLPSLDLSSRGGKVSNPYPSVRGNTGRIVVRSFKGRVNVAPLAGIEMERKKQP